MCNPEPPYIELRRPWQVQQPMAGTQSRHRGSSFLAMCHMARRPVPLCSVPSRSNMCCCSHEMAEEARGGLLFLPAPARRLRPFCWHRRECGFHGSTAGSRPAPCSSASRSARRRPFASRRATSNAGSPQCEWETRPQSSPLAGRRQAKVGEFCGSGRTRCSSQRTVREE